MNASERLQAIIRERREWEEFGWGPALAAWTVVLVLKALVELWTGPRIEVGAAAYAIALGVQLLIPVFPGAPEGSRQVPMHGLWALVALSAWFFGSWAPGSGLMPALGASVVELAFLGGGLVVTGFLKRRRALVVCGATLVAEAILVAVCPALWAWRPLGLVAAFGTAAAVSLVTDRRNTPLNDTKPSP